MLGSFATLKRLSSDFERLATESGPLVGEAADCPPREAAALVQEEYAPLLNGTGQRASSDTGDGDSECTIKPLPPRVKVLEIACTYAAFFVLGSTILLPWNAIIIAQSYFQSRLIGSPYEHSFASFVALTFTVCNLAFLAHANYTQQTANPLFRIFSSIATIATTLLLFCLSTRVGKFDGGIFFFALLSLVGIAAAGASYLQNAVIGLAALFGPSYLQSILSGQGGIGFGVSIVQLLIAIESSRSKQASLLMAVTEDGLEAYKGVLRKTAFAFFLVAAFIAVFAFLCHMILLRLPFYRFTVRSSQPSLPDDKQDAPEPASLRQVERKVRILGFAIFWVFFVTLAIFPVITASILSVHTPANAAELSFFSPTIFVPFHFVVFNMGDWLGRSAPSMRFLRFTSTRTLVVASALRALFVPLFLACNVSGVPSGHRVAVKSDTVFFLILLSFAFTNGWLSTLIMIAGVKLPSLDRPEIDLAATALAFYLTVGLAAGSLASFAVRSAICYCNPFLSS